MTLDSWLRRKKMTEEAFARLVDNTCTQSLVSKWRRKKSVPGPIRRESIRQITGGLVDMKVRR